MIKKNCSICDHRGEYDGTPICRKGATLTDAINYIKAPYCPFPDKKDKTPTLEEVIKEWEELGYELKTKTEYPHMIYLVNDDDEIKWVLSININTETKKYWKHWGNMEFESFTFQEHNLLTKTFRALGWFDE